LTSIIESSILINGKMKRLITFLLSCLSLFAFLLSDFSFSKKIYSQSDNRDLPLQQILVHYRSDLSIDDRLKFHRMIDGESIGAIERINVEVLRVRSGVMDEVVNKLSQDKNVIYAEPDYIAYAYELSNDPGIMENLQWGMYKVQAAGTAESGWNVSRGNSNIKVAVLDTGIDTSHEDLKGKVAASHNCTDTFTSDDSNGHGTHVAGIIAASTNNGKGVSGLGYNTTLYNVKTLNNSGSGYYSWIANCLVWAADNGADVISMSLGGSNNSRTLEDAVNYAYQKGVVIVAAAGNEGSSSPSYPAYFSNVISVAATDKNDGKPSWSNWGSWVDVAAPGVSIYSTLPSHYNSFRQLNYGQLSGTSMAAPHVAGLAALILSAADVNNSQVAKTIEEYADKISGTGQYWQYGRINAYRSLLSLRPVAERTVVSPTPTIIIAMATPTNVPPTPTPTFIPTPSPTITSSPTPTIAAKPSPTPVKSPWLRFCLRYSSFCR